MTERIDEFNLTDNIPGIGRAKDFMQQRAGRQEAQNIADFLMKRYMGYLGRNKQKATLITLKDFVRQSLDNEQHYEKVVDRELEKQLSAGPSLTDKAKANFAKYGKAAAGATANKIGSAANKVGGAANKFNNAFNGPAQKSRAAVAGAVGNVGSAIKTGAQTAAGAVGNVGSAIKTGAQTAAGAVGNVGSAIKTGAQTAAGAVGNTITPPRKNPVRNNPPPLNQQSQIEKDAELINKDITNPAKIKDTLNALHTLVSTANQQGGRNKEQVQQWLRQVRGNEEVARDNPKLMRALRGESVEQLVDFATFLVECNITSRDEFRGSLNFLFEAPVYYQNSEGQGIPSNEDGTFPGTQDEDFLNTDEQAKILNKQLPRSVVGKYLFAIAAAMIDSGDFSYDPVRGGHGNVHGGGHSIDKPSHGWNGGAHTIDDWKIDTDKLKKFQENAKEKEKISDFDWGGIELALKKGLKTYKGIVKFAENEIKHDLSKKAKQILRNPGFRK